MEEVTDQKIILDLTVNEVNGILAALAKLPFEQVADLIAKVRDQGVSQVQAATPETTE